MNCRECASERAVFALFALAVRVGDERRESDTFGLHASRACLPLHPAWRPGCDPKAHGGDTVLIWLSGIPFWRSRRAHALLNLPPAVSD
jgi:hypothetical protein